MSPKSSVMPLKVLFCHQKCCYVAKTNDMSCYFIICRARKTRESRNSRTSLNVSLFSRSNKQNHLELFRHFLIMQLRWHSLPIGSVCSFRLLFGIIRPPRTEANRLWFPHLRGIRRVTRQLLPCPSNSHVTRPFTVSIHFSSLFSLHLATLSFSFSFLVPAGHVRPEETSEGRIITCKPLGFSA